MKFTGLAKKLTGGGGTPEHPGLGCDVGCPIEMKDSQWNTRRRIITIVGFEVYLKGKQTATFIHTSVNHSG